MADEEVTTALLRGQQLDLKLTIPQGSAVDAPIVVLLGWVGSKDRFLAKYSDFLGEAGYPTIRGICPTSSIFSVIPAPRRRWARDLLRFIRAVDPEGSRPVVFYAFSNGGAFVVEQLRELLAKGAEFGHLRARVRGVMFDSTPAFMFLRSGARALREGNPPLMKVLLTIVFYLGILVMAVLDPHRRYNFWCAMTHLHLPGPTLYLYSDDDPLCDVDKLSVLISTRRLAGAQVQERRWAVSQHVGHLRCHPQEYKDAVLGFLRPLHA